MTPSWWAHVGPLFTPMRDLFKAIAADPQWADRFWGLNAETVDPDAFFGATG